MACTLNKDVLKEIADINVTMAGTEFKVDCGSWVLIGGTRDHSRVSGVEIFKKARIQMQSVGTGLINNATIEADGGISCRHCKK